MPSEVMLEEFLERDPSLLGERLLVIGRQVHTPYGKIYWRWTQTGTLTS